MFYTSIKEAMEAELQKHGVTKAKPLPRRPMFHLAGEQHRCDLPCAVLAVVKRRGQSS